MSSMSRTATVAIVALTLVLLSVPAVHARPIERSGPSIETGAGWMDAALSWFSQLLFGEQPASQDQPRPTFDASNLDGFNQPLSGSCIDPEGRPRPCTGL
jgi:hypothetical protein